MDRLSDKRKFDVVRDVIVGGCIFCFLGPIISITTLFLLSAGQWQTDANPFEWYIYSLLLSFITGYYIPFALTGVFMGWLGTRFRRGWTVCCGMASGVLLFFLYAVIWRRSSSFDFGIIMVTPIFPSLILSWWLYGWIKKRAMRHAEMQLG